ncbi:AbrB/MazE/SpoVT family DNA-binding domain-containing protein [Allosphingosinicella sp.]|uniref:AbrB/MazE/SpoVT family DNA-binding domain-containing protein n=1 Tax=Allosphingosinicella sp. TaxID=2823234 RepID=UPI003D758130
MQTKISAKGQVVIPKAVRDRLSWSEGDRLDVIETAEGVLLRPPPIDGERITIEEFRRRVPAHPDPAVSLAQMEEAILAEASERYERKTRR